MILFQVVFKILTKTSAGKQIITAYKSRNKILNRSLRSKLVRLIIKSDFDYKFQHFAVNGVLNSYR